MRRGLRMYLLAACAGPEADDAGDSGEVPVTAYKVRWATEPAPVEAGAEVTFTASVRDQLDRPIEDLVSAHERMLHTLVISRDLTSFQHLHLEDFRALTAEDIRSSTFEFPLTLPLAGDYRLVFDFAHQNAYLSANDWLTATGAPEMGSVYLDYATEQLAGDLTLTLRWDVEPVVGYESIWAIEVHDAAGAEVTDLVQYLGADAHAALVTTDLTWTSHTHAWFPGMEDVAPGHDMPSLNHGPDLPFHYTFPVAGSHKMWIQLAREGVEGTYVAAFAFDVAP